MWEGFTCFLLSSSLSLPFAMRPVFVCVVCVCFSHGDKKVSPKITSIIIFTITIPAMLVIVNPNGQCITHSRQLPAADAHTSLVNWIIGSSAVLVSQQNTHVEGSGFSNFRVSNANYIVQIEVAIVSRIIIHLLSFDKSKSHRNRKYYQIYCANIDWNIPNIPIYTNGERTLNAAATSIHGIIHTHNSYIAELSTNSNYRKWPIPCIGCALLFGRPGQSQLTQINT